MHSPDAAQADERGPRPQHSAFLTELVDDRPSLDKASVATQRYEGWRGFRRVSARSGTAVVRRRVGSGRSQRNVPPGRVPGIYGVV